MKFIDADSHVLPANLYDHIKNHAIRDQLPNFLFAGDGQLLPGSLTVDPNRQWSMAALPPVGYNASGRTDIKTRIRQMPDLGVDFQILNPDEISLRFCYLIDPEIGKEIAYCYNRAVRDIVMTYPDKFAATLLLPLQDMDWSLREMEWGRNNGFRSFVVDASWPIADSPISPPLVCMPRIDDLMRQAVDLDMLMVVHQQMHKREIRWTPTVKQLRLQTLYPSNYEIVLVSMITSGLMDRHPRARVLIAEGGMAFIQIALNHLRRIGMADAAQRVARNFLFTIEPEEKETLLRCIEELGAECFLFATDYPHNDEGGQNKWYDAHNFRDLPLTKKQQQRIGRGNAIKAFGLTQLSG